MARETVASPGAKLGKKIGEMMEKALAARMLSLANKHGCHYLGPAPNPDAKNKVLRLRDEFGAKHRIDAAIFSGNLRPLMLLELKSVPRKKRGRDEGNRICRVHQSLRRRFNSAPKSMAVLAGGWTESSVAMIKSAQVDVFLVPYEKISALLAARGVDFDWGEQDRDMAVHAWMTYEKLPPAVRRKIAEDMVADILPSFSEAIDSALQSDAKPEIADVVVEFYAATGEIRREHFDTVESAARYLNDASAEAIFDLEGAPTVCDSVKGAED